MHPHIYDIYYKTLRGYGFEETGGMDGEELITTLRLRFDAIS